MTDVVFSYKNLPEPTTETFTGWVYDFVSIKVNRETNRLKVYGIDKQYNLKVITSNLDFSNPQVNHEIPYIRSHHAMCFGDTKETLYFCSRDKLCSLTGDTVTEIVEIQGESFSHMAYKQGYIYVTTNVGIDIYSEALKLYQYRHVPTLPFHRLYGIVSIEQDLYLQTDDTLFSVGIERYGMLSETHSVLLTGLTIDVTTITGMDVLTIDTTSYYYMNENMYRTSYQVDLQLTTLCFSTYHDGMNVLCFYSFKNTGHTVYYSVSNLFTVYDTTLYFYTPTDWKVRGPIGPPIIRGYDNPTPTTYRLLVTENILDVYIQNVPIDYDPITKVITSVTRPRTINVTNGFFATIFYLPFIEESPKTCMSGDTLVWKGNSLKRVTSVTIGSEVVSIVRKNDAYVEVIAPVLPLGTYTCILEFQLELSGFLNTQTIEYVSYEIVGLSQTIGKTDTLLTLYGQGLNQVETVQFGTFYSEITPINDYELRVRVPIVRDIVPLRINQQPAYYTNGSPILFSEIFVEDVSPLKGMVGDILKVKGTNLALVNKVSFDKKNAFVVEKQYSSLHIRVPTSIPNNSPLYFNESGTDFLFQYVPYEINRISVYESNQQVSFEGKGLMNVTSVLFGSMDAPIVRKRYDTITVTLPVQLSVSTVLVTFKNNETTLSKYIDDQNVLYTYIPKIVSISKTKGVQGEEFLLTGFYLNQVNAFFFGNVQSILTNRTNQSFTVTVPKSIGLVPLRGRVELAGIGTTFLSTRTDGSTLEFEYMQNIPNCNKKKDICLKAIYSYPSNQLSTKRLQASMIRNHTKITYNNTRLKTIYNLMLGLDYVINRNLLFQYKYSLYTRYLNDLIQGNITQKTKQDLSNMLQGLVLSLTQTEYYFVFQLTPPAPLIIPDIIIDSYYTFYVVQRKISTRSYFIFKNISSNFLLEPLNFYTFDVSDPSNLNSKLSFSEDKYTGIPYRGVEYISIPGTPGAKVILSIYKDIGSLQFYIYNATETITLFQYTWGYCLEKIMIHLDNSLVESATNFVFEKSRQYSYLSIYESSGPKFSINDTLNPIIYLEFNQNCYILTYGTYYYDIPKTYAATLLNKGYEDSISFLGDSDKKLTGPIYGTSLATKEMTTLQEGSYDFYYGRVRITIYKPFLVNLSVYSYSFGFMGGMRLLKFSETIDNKDNIVSLTYFNTLKKGSILRLNGDTNVGELRYGVSMGNYILTIDPSMNIAFLNNGKEELFQILNTPGTVTSGPFIAPDGRYYTFYSGRIHISIKGWFETMSMCTRTGYSGGYKLLAYNSYNGSSTNYVYSTLNTTKGLCFQNNIYIYESKVIYFNDDDNTPHTYGLYRGVYTIFNIPEKFPITLLNKNKESLVVLESLSNTSRKGTAPDGTIYTFYYGTLRITVHGDFGRLSLYTLFNGYMSGLGMFIYNEVFDNRISYPDARSVPIVTPVSANTLYTDTSISPVYVSLEILMNGSVPLDIATPYRDLYTFPVTYNVLNITSTLSFNSEQPDTNKKYILKTGIYVLNSSAYITLLNKDNDRIKMIGILSQTSISADGYKYTFFKGNTIAIYVYGNFGLCSLEVLGGPLGNYLLCHEDNIYS